MIVGASTKDKVLSQVSDLWDSYAGEIQKAADLKEDITKKPLKIAFSVDLLELNDIDNKVTTHIRFIKEVISDRIEEEVPEREDDEDSGKGKGKGKKK